MPEHYFSKRPEARYEPFHFKTDLFGHEMKIHSASSIFSSRGLDFGTRLLIENCEVPEKADVLDLGCGYGIVGVSLKKIKPGINVTMLDINERATTFAAKNCKESGVDCNVIHSDLFQNPEVAEKKFDIILTNPPFSAGKQVCIEFIKQSYEHIKKGGSLQLVAPHNKGGASLKKVMIEVFGSVDELVKKSGYRVYKATRQD